MISVSGISKHFGDRVLFDDVSLRVGARGRVALVGPNGSGKTTLFEMIAGAQSPDGGTVQIARDVVIGYLRQETDALRGRSVLQEVISAGASMTQAGHRLDILTQELEEVQEPKERDALLTEYAHLQERFEALGGYTIEAQARTILAGLGFREQDAERRTEALSGGWLMRVALAKLLLAAPDVLLLDEPTNHLDLESVAWLERFLRTYDGAVLLVSHDRDFMNAIAGVVVEIEDSKLVSYTGDYAAFVRQRVQRAEQAAAAAAGQARKRAQTQVFIDRFRYKASKARQVQSRIKSLDKMEKIQLVTAQRRAMRIAFPTPPRAGRISLELRKASFSYGEVPVYRDLTFALERGQKVALVGPNGAGKTTLLKLLAGALTPQHGERVLGNNVFLGYFAQHQIEALDPKNRVIEELDRAVPPGVTVRTRDLLGRFLFSGDDAQKPVSVLSGGERSRLALAKLLVSPFNVLCLDEPTNHLDIQSRDVLEDALEEYEGAMVLITHDRHLIRSVADHIVEVIDGVVREFPGDYESYLEKKEQEGARTGSTAKGAAKGGKGAVRESAAEAKERKRAGADARAKTKRQRDAVRDVEQEIERLHAESARLAALLADTEFYARGVGVADAVRTYETTRARVAQLETEWARLSEELERATTDAG